MRPQPNFRFYCNMPLAGNPAYTRAFQTTAEDPLVAMERVLASVESWRGERRTGTVTR